VSETESLFVAVLSPFRQHRRVARRDFTSARSQNRT
jgi:hypothetical protein